MIRVTMITNYRCRNSSWRRACRTRVNPIETQGPERLLPLGEASKRPALERDLASQLVSGLDGVDRSLDLGDPTE